MTDLPFTVQDRGYVTPCHVYSGNINKDGYGRVKIEGRTFLAHKVAFGLVPAGRELDHRCRVKACIRGDHLEAVTHAENVRRAARKLTRELAAEIRVSEGSCREVGERYGVSRSTVSEIRRGVTWA